MLPFLLSVEAVVLQLNIDSYKESFLPTVRYYPKQSSPQ